MRQVDIIFYSDRIFFIVDHAYASRNAYAEFRRNEKRWTAAAKDYLFGGLCVKDGKIMEAFDVSLNLKTGGKLYDEHCIMAIYVMPWNWTFSVSAFGYLHPLKRMKLVRRFRGRLRKGVAYAHALNVAIGRYGGYDRKNRLMPGWRYRDDCRFLEACEYMENVRSKYKPLRISG